MTVYDAPNASENKTLGIFCGNQTGTNTFVKSTSNKMFVEVNQYSNKYYATTGVVARVIFTYGK